MKFAALLLLLISLVMAERQTRDPSTSTSSTTYKFHTRCIAFKNVDKKSQLSTGICLRSASQQDVYSAAVFYEGLNDGPGAQEWPCGEHDLKFTRNMMSNYSERQLSCEGKLFETILLALNSSAAHYFDDVSNGVKSGVMCVLVALSSEEDIDSYLYLTPILATGDIAPTQLNNMLVMGVILGICFLLGALVLFGRQGFDLIARWSRVPNRFRIPIRFMIPRGLRVDLTVVFAVNLVGFTGQCIVLKCVTDGKGSGVILILSHSISMAILSKTLATGVFGVYHFDITTTARESFSLILGVACYVLSSASGSASSAKDDTTWKVVWGVIGFIFALGEVISLLVTLFDLVFHTTFIRQDACHTAIAVSTILIVLVNVPVSYLLVYLPFDGDTQCCQALRYAFFGWFPYMSNTLWFGLVSNSVKCLIIYSSVPFSVGWIMCQTLPLQVTLVWVVVFSLFNTGGVNRFRYEFNEEERLVRELRQFFTHIFHTGNVNIHENIELDRLGFGLVNRYGLA